MRKGFTLIELMIVVAIIGILAMMAIPAYNDYVKRTYVAEGFANLAPLKIAILEYYDANGRLPYYLNDIKNYLTILDPHPSGIYTGVYQTSPKTFVALYFPGTPESYQFGGVLYMYVSEDIQKNQYSNWPAEVPIVPVIEGGTITWVCGAEAVRKYPRLVSTGWGQNSIKDRYLPSACRLK